MASKTGQLHGRDHLPTGSDPIPGGVPGVSGLLLYEYTVSGSDKASIDTTVDGTYAGSFDQSLNVLECWMLIRTDDAAAQHNVDLTVNGLTTSIYDNNWVEGLNGVASSNRAMAQPNWYIDAHGSGGAANCYSLISLTLPFYSATVAYKVAYQSEDMYDTSSSLINTLRQSFGIRTSAAITSMKVAAQGAAKLKVGSSLLIYAR